MQVRQPRWNKDREVVNILGDDGNERNVEAYKASGAGWQPPLHVLGACELSRVGGLRVRKPSRSIRSMSAAARPTRSCFRSEPEPLLRTITLQTPPSSEKLFPLVGLSRAPSAREGDEGRRKPSRTPHPAGRALGWFRID
jgi:hypothetical protein